MGFNNSELSQRSLKIISCISLFLIGLIVLLIGLWICKIPLIGMVFVVLGGASVFFGIIPMIAFWCTWQDLSDK